MTDWSDETLRSLDELARIAFPENSGVTGKTLQRLARQGKLIVYKPGGKYLSTLANLRRALDATRPKPQLRPGPMPEVPNGLGLTAMEISRMRLDHALEQISQQEQEKKLAERAERARANLLRKAERDAERREARKAARQKAGPPRKSKKP